MRGRYRGRKFIFSILAALFFLGTASFADEKIIENPLKAKASFSSAHVAPGSQNVLNININLAEGHKAYVDMFKIVWRNPKDLKVNGFTVTPSFKFEDKFSKQVREGMKDDAVLSALVEMPENLSIGQQTFEFDFIYQVCTESYCHFPKTVTMKIPVQIVSAAEYLPEGKPSAQQDSFLSAMSRGRGYTLLIVFFAGILTSLTPCVFPMIPITLAIIGARATHQTKLKSFTLSLIYVLGIAFTYSVLGILAARTGSLFGSYLGHPVAVSAISLIFVAMGLSMYGLFELQAPQFITRRLMTGKTSAGYFGSFISGLVAGFVASPCVGPVLVGILTYVANSQDLIFGFLLLFVFALGLGQLFLWLGTFGGMLQKLPKSGPWMEFINFVFGSTMIAAALWFLRPVIQERLFYALVAITLVLVSSGFGVFEAPGISKIKQIKKGFLLLLLVLGLALGAKAVWYKNAAPAAPTYEKLNWQEYSDSALMAAKRDRRPVIVDFWADWCVACKELEMFTFSTPNVRELSKEFLLLKLDATKSTHLVERLKRQHNVVGLPTILFYSSSGEIRRDLTLTGFEDATAFEKRMKSALSN